MAYDPFKALLDKDANPQGKDVPVRMRTSSGRYRLGPPQRPNIHHDNGHLDDGYKPEAPTVKDRIDYFIWLGKGEGAYALCRPGTSRLVSKCENSDQRDATAAYLHYMGNSGITRTVNYGDFLTTDQNGIEVRKLVIADIKFHIEMIGENRTKFQITGEAIPVGDLKNEDLRPPVLNQYYPSSINWIRTVGGHTIWASADVSVSVLSKSSLLFDALITIHMEDMYNFNRGAKDVTTGIPDKENGRFQFVGLAKQYLNIAEFTQKEVWTAVV